MSKTRLDALLVARGLAESRDWAQRLIRAGEVRVNDQVVDQPAKLFDASVAVVVEKPPKYVSRGGFKLEAALDFFGVNPNGCVCADVGSSTGGFTDCLLQRGAAKIFCVDVGANQLHWKLRNDPRVVAMEKLNARFLDELPLPIDLAVIDVSFISLKLILPKVFRWSYSGEGSVIALIKPQFEVGKDKVGKGGIVRDPNAHRETVERIVKFVENHGWRSEGVIDSPIFGADGNKEFLIWARSASNR
jgi:23S rRNA (cytidine1920-2'-O)/16S rRNA (cytidine1409-2'-O)-methyltransferase